MIWQFGSLGSVFARNVGLISGNHRAGGRVRGKQNGSFGIKMVFMQLAVVSQNGGAVLDGVLERVTFANPDAYRSLPTDAQIARPVTTPRYGRQFEVHSYTTVLPATAAGIRGRSVSSAGALGRSERTAIRERLALEAVTLCERLTVSARSHVRVRAA